MGMFLTPLRNGSWQSIASILDDAVLLLSLSLNVQNMHWTAFLFAMATSEMRSPCICIIRTASTDNCGAKGAELTQ